MTNTFKSDKVSPFIIDTDMGPDDWMAILQFALSQRGAIQAITVTGTGIAHGEQGARNALTLMALVGTPDVPVAIGSSSPMSVTNHPPWHKHYPPEWRKSADELLGIPPPASNPNSPSDQTAVGLIGSILQGAEQKVSILALGPLTNIAQAFQEFPSVITRIEHLYIMGGAVGIDGNVHATYPKYENTTAEWNIFIDPQAASIVFSSGVPITLIPLNATNEALVTIDFVDRLKKAAASPAAQFVAQVLEKQREIIKAGQYCFWDPLVAGAAIHPAFVERQQMHIAVQTQHGKDWGRTHRASQGGAAQVGTGVRKGQLEKFKDFFITTLAC